MDSVSFIILKDTVNIRDIIKSDCDKTFFFMERRGTGKVDMPKQNMPFNQHLSYTTI